MAAAYLLPALWPYLLRKGSYIVPVFNILMALMLIVPDVMALYSKGILFPDLSIPAKELVSLLSSSISLSSLHLTFLLSYRVQPQGSANNDVGTDAVERLSKEYVRQRPEYSTNFHMTPTAYEIKQQEASSVLLIKGNSHNSNTPYYSCPSEIVEEKPYVRQRPPYSCDIENDGILIANISNDALLGILRKNKKEYSSAADFFLTDNLEEEHEQKEKINIIFDRINEKES
jgi:hypothetical protein